MPSNLACLSAGAEPTAQFAARPIGRAARLLRKFRERTGLEIDKFAFRVGLSESLIQAAENSPNDYLPFKIVKPMVPTLIRFGTSFAEILMLLALPHRVRLLRNRYRVKSCILPTCWVMPAGRATSITRSSSGLTMINSRMRFFSSWLTNFAKPERKRKS